MLHCHQQIRLARVLVGDECLDKHHYAGSSDHQDTTKNTKEDRGLGELKSLCLFLYIILSQCRANNTSMTF